MREVTAKIWLDDYGENHLLAKEAFSRNMGIATDELNDVSFGPPDKYCRSISDSSERYGARKFFEQMVSNDQLWATVKSERKRLNIQYLSLERIKDTP